MNLRTFVTTVALAAVSFSAGAVTVLINYEVVDGAPAGFNHSDPPTQAARREAFERALKIWTTQMAGNVTLDVRVYYENDSFFPGQAAVLATGKPASASANLSGLPFPDTFYPAALASQLAGTSLPATAGQAMGFHMQVIFNDVFNSSPFGNPIWWYEFENPTGPGNVSFVTVALHELGHAFGMASLV